MCVHVCVCVVCVCVYVCVCLRVCVCVCVCLLYVCVCTRTYVCTCVCTHATLLVLFGVSCGLFLLSLFAPLEVVPVPGDVSAEVVREMFISQGKSYKVEFTLMEEGARLDQVSCACVLRVCVFYCTIVRVCVYVCVACVCTSHVCCTAVQDRCMYVCVCVCVLVRLVALYDIVCSVLCFGVSSSFPSGHAPCPDGKAGCPLLLC